MNHSPRPGFRLVRMDRFSALKKNNTGSLENSVHYTSFQAMPLAALLATALTLGGLVGCAAQPETPEPVVEPVVREAPAQQPRQPVEIAPRAPERYVVKKGDTLWDISTMFLRDPWLWPEIWYTNPQIQNPHLIFPGDIITIFWHDGRPHLRIEREGEIYQTTLPLERLSPRVRVLPLAQAIPTIPIDAIRPFLGHPRVIDRKEYERLPYVVRSRDGRLLSGAADNVYVRGVNTGDPLRYHLIRLGNRYKDPVSGETLGWEAIEVGQGSIRRHGDPATLLLEATVRESMQGDRLIPVEETEYSTNFLPRAPEQPIDARIIDVVDGVEQVGQYQIVTLNKGARDGLEPGHVLDVYQRGERIRDNVGTVSRSVQLPDEQAGTLMVFRTFDRVSYGLIMRASREIYVLDMARNP